MSAWPQFTTGNPTLDLYNARRCATLMNEQTDNKHRFALQTFGTGFLVKPQWQIPTCRLVRDDDTVDTSGCIPVPERHRVTSVSRRTRIVTESSQESLASQEQVWDNAKQMVADIAAAVTNKGN